MDASIYNQKGTKAGSISLPAEIFDAKWNADLVHTVMVSLQSNERSTIAHAKGRGEVSGGGIKPWRQKGTGRARHGSIRSPIWIGGGVAHGPNKEKNFFKKINRKEKAKALVTILSQKMRDGEILFVDALSLPEAKTKNAKEILTSLAGIKGFEDMARKSKNAVLITLPERNDEVLRSFKNFGNVKVEEVRNMSPLSLLTYKYIMIVNPEQAVSFLSAKAPAGSAEKKAPAKKKKATVTAK